MRLVRVLILTAAMVTVMAAAFAAPSTATVMCEIGTIACPEEDIYPAKTTVSGVLKSGTQATFEGGFGSVKCSESILEGQSLEKEAGQLTGTLASLKLLACKSGETSCTVTASTLPFNTKLTYTSGDEGTLLVSSKEKTPTVKFECGKIINCSASGNLELTMDGGEPGSIIASKEPLTGEGACAKTTFTATYTLNAPSSGYVFVAQAQVAGTLLCSEPPETVMGKLKCPTGKSYSGEIKGELAAGNAEFKSMAEPAKGVSCNQTTYEGQFESDGTKAAVNGGINKLAFSSIVGGIPNKPCSGSFEAANPVKVTVEGLSYRDAKFFYQSVFNPQGGFEVRANMVDIKFEIENGMNPLPTCKYTAPRLWGYVVNGAGMNPSQMTLIGSRLVKVAGGAGVCPPDLQLTAQVTVKGVGGGNVYIARD